MDSSLNSLTSPMSPLFMRVTRETVRNGPAATTAWIDLKTEVVVQAGAGMIVLVDDEVVAEVARCAAVVETCKIREGKSGCVWCGREIESLELVEEIVEVVGDYDLACFD